MRVAVDAANLARDRRGLGRIVRAVLAAAAADAGVDLTLLADAPADVRALRAAFPAFAVRRTTSARRRGAYDVVWFPFNGMRYRVGPPSLVSIADAFAFTEPHAERIARFREQAPVRRAAREASAIVTISQWSRGELARELALAPERIAVIAPAPDPFFSPGFADALPPPLEPGRFALLVGAREPRKNVRLALEAAARALRAGEWLAIAGTLEPHDRSFARTRGVRAGEIAPSDGILRALYRRAGAVLVPSLAEGYGLVAAEALACGAPVIAADAAALPEATGGAALLLDPRDAGAWAAALRHVFDDPALAASLRARAAARFALADRDRPARDLVTLLRELASQSRGSEAHDPVH